MSEFTKRTLFLIAFLLPILIWPFCKVDLGVPFQFDVPSLQQINLFESNAFYLYIHLFSVIPVFLLSFDKKVGFYKSWKKLFPAIFIVGIGFVVWDVLFTYWNVWGFNKAYFLGIEFFGLPVEELLFFVSIPFASLFIHECMIAYFPNDSLRKMDGTISLLLSLGLITLGILHFDRIYTSTTCLTTGLAIGAHFLFFENKYRTLFYRSFVIVLIPFIIVDGALTGWFTKAPIVLYNPEEFLGLRIGAVPVEDAIYGLLLLLLITTFQDWLVGPKPSKH